MIKLEAGNVLLKPSHRREMMSGLRRALRMGSRLGEFGMTIRMHRCGRQCEVRAEVHDAAGDFVCRSRQPHWRDAMREMMRRLVNRLHQQQLEQALTA